MPDRRRTNKRVSVCVQFARFVLGETRHAQESFAVLVADAIVAGETTTLAHCGSAARLEWESRLNRDIANTHRHTHSRTMRLRAMGDGEEVVDEYREGHGPAQRTFNREQRRNSDIALSLCIAFVRRTQRTSQAGAHK